MTMQVEKFPTIPKMKIKEYITVIGIRDSNGKCLGPK